MRLAWLLLLVPLAGCTEDPSFAISGAFAEDRADADIEELQTLAQEHGGTAQIRESSPEQFTVSDMSEDDCEPLRAVLLEKAYLETVGPCTAEDEGADPY